MSIKVLAVAPRVPGQPELAIWSELGHIGDIDGVDLTIVPQPNKQRIANWLRRALYDVFLWIGHGAPGKLLTADEPIDPTWLAHQLRGANVPVAIISACMSSVRPEAEALTPSFSDTLPAAGVNTITMMVNVSDLAALQYDIAVVQSLAAGIPLRQAHTIGTAAAAFHGDGQAPQLFPADEAQVPMSTMTNNSSNDILLRSISDKMDKISDQVQALAVRQERMETQISAVVQEQSRMTAQVDKEIAAMKQSMDQLVVKTHSATEFKHWMIAAPALFITLVVIILLILERLAQ